MKANKQTIWAHHDPNPIYYTLTLSELESLKDKARVPQKENAFFLGGLFIPALLNVLGTIFSTNFAINALFVVNLLIMIVTFLLGFFQAREWNAKRKSFKEFVDTLKSKPQIEMQVFSTAESYVRPPAKEHKTRNSSK